MTSFIQQEPHNGEPGSERTEAWVLFDDENIYLACRCWDSTLTRSGPRKCAATAPTSVTTTTSASCSTPSTTSATGTSSASRRAAALPTALVTDERSLNSDWNAVWTSHAARFEGGWIAEMAIPFKTLRYDAADVQTWGINLRRMIRTKNEYVFIVPMSKAWPSSTAMLHVAAAATLVGLEAPPAAVNLGGQAIRPVEHQDRPGRPSDPHERLLQQCRRRRRSAASPRE